METNLKQKEIIKKISDYVELYFSENLPDWVRYHSLDHTIETVEACFEIGNESGINNDEIEILLIAAWFHDIGYNISADNHEEESVIIATSFLESINYRKEKIIEVNKCIKATKISANSNNLLESIIKDADLISLGRKDFNEKNELLKREIELRDEIKITNIAWIKRSIDFITAHRFLTNYAKEKFNFQQNDNLKKLREQLEQEEMD